MCTPWTVTRLVRWRVKDWAINFLACGFPLGDEEEPDTFCSRSSPQVSTVNMIFDTTDEDQTRSSTTKMKTKTTTTKRCNQDIETTGTSKKRISRSTIDIADDDYIVFCFGEDGAFDVVKDVRFSSLSEASNDDRRVEFSLATKSSSRPVNRKLNYGDENGERACKEIYEVVLNEVEEENEEECVYLDSRSTASIRIDGGDEIYEESEEYGTVSFESNGSNQSDNSTASFSFPVLGLEWSGSPVQMPKSEGLHLRKHKGRFVPFQCFRF